MASREFEGNSLNDHEYEAFKGSDGFVLDFPELYQVLVVDLRTANPTNSVRWPSLPYARLLDYDTVHREWIRTVSEIATLDQLETAEAQADKFKLDEEFWTTAAALTMRHKRHDASAFKNIDIKTLTGTSTQQLFTSTYWTSLEQSVAAQSVDDWSNENSLGFQLYVIKEQLQDLEEAKTITPAERLAEFRAITDDESGQWFDWEPCFTEDDDTPDLGAFIAHPDKRMVGDPTELFDKTKYLLLTDYFSKKECIWTAMLINFWQHRHWVNRLTIFHHFKV